MVRISALFVAVVVVVVFIGGTSFAQSGDEELTGTTQVFDHFLVNGGAITWFILVPLSVATVALTIEYCLSIRRKTFVPPETLSEIEAQLAERQYVRSLQYTAEDPSVLAYVVNTGLTAAANGRAAMERAVADAIEDRSARLMRKIEYLNVIGNISPMVGLFGTVYGMIRLFASIRQAGGMPEPARIADDISIALVTTFWGLLVAIPALSVFAIFRNRIDSLSAECALTVDRLFSRFATEADINAQAKSA
ncbi:MAG: MotA/TolQ/ExbB proton channel family protein [Planctomycetes bacterium]|nr:MotA/TolQ/ExbB proton channel family protein [Planctomycetota bacterium]